MSRSMVVITFEGDDALRTAVKSVLGDYCDIVYLSDLSAGERAAALESASALVSYNIAGDLRPDELNRPVNAKLIQLLSAGVDHAPFGKLPQNVPVAYNPGAFADAMAEHAVAMTLAAAKRLFVEDRNMRNGEFNQFVQNRLLRGGVCAILGFGCAGRSTARLFRCFDMKIYAINSSGKTDEPIDFIGRTDDLEKVLGEADVIIITLALTRTTEGLLGRRELSWMKKDAILVNISRGEIIDESAFYDHLKANPDFTACIESWWIEPVRHGEFRTNYPFLDLPNVIAAPHNSASVPGSIIEAVRRGAENVRRILTGGEARFMVTEDQRIR